MEESLAFRRRVSSAVFGNEKTAEVVPALVEFDGAFTATDISDATGISHGLVRAVLVRLAKEDVVLRALPKAGSRMGPQYYERQDSDCWPPLLELARSIRSMAVSR